MRREFAAAFQNGMDGDDFALIENADYIVQLLHLDNAPRTVWYAVIVAADRYEPVVADTALEFEQRVERPRWQRLQLGSLGGKRLRDDFLRGAVYARTFATRSNIG
ncbi:hypothetical protein ACVIHH_008362 [Bradyrhizobium sp. USDA 4518]